jgi:hypothetical protein
MRMSTWIAVLVAIIVPVCGGQGPAAAPGSSGPNVGQVERLELDPASGWPCPNLLNPTRTDNQLFEIPGLTLSITTTGNPVLVAVMMNVRGGSESLFWSLIIDGQGRNQDEMTHVLTPAPAGTLLGDTLNYHRVISLAAGAHTIGVGMSCAGTTIVVYRSWLTAYELPMVKK